MLPPIVYAFFGTCQEPSTAGHQKTPENSLFLGCRCFFPWAEIAAIVVYALTLACQLANFCFLPWHIGIWHPFAVESFQPSGIRCPCISWHWRTCEPFNWWGRNAQGARWCLQTNTKSDGTYGRWMSYKLTIMSSIPTAGWRWRWMM
jgi:hypothetical protein